jgi:chromosome segregation protein
MKIRSIEVSGFKSFCDRAVLRFDSSTTAIVGPNGCGKSNIVDAIRWAMGEQSPQKLRGKAMEEVIFAGSESRGPVGVAEVSITYENTGGLPPQYAAYPEIVVARRLYRDGTSEYLVNKLPVRLRDVVDLFLGTGVGRAAYSIIEQGRVGFIVSARPEDRRQILEEAAGVTKYRLKKRAAERRMESTRQNLLRLSDILCEIDKQVGALRRQAQKAERYKRYRAEMRDLELWAGTFRMLELRGERRVVGLEHDAAQARRGEVSAELVRREAAVEADRLALTEEERQLAQLTERAYGVANETQLCEQGIRIKGESADAEDKQAERAEHEAELHGRQVDEVTAAAARIEALLAAVEGEREARSAELGTLETRARDERERVGRMEAELHDARERLSSEQIRSAAADARHEAVAAERAALGERLERQRGERAERAAHEDDVLQEIAALEERVGTSRRSGERQAESLAQAKGALDRLRGDAERAAIEVETLRDELGRRRSRLGSLREIERRYEGFQRGVRAIMSGGEPRRGVRALVAEVLFAPAEYEAALEAVLGERLGNVIVDSPEAGAEAIEFLKQRCEGRSSFIPLAPRGHGNGASDGLPAGDGVRGPMLSLIDYDRSYESIAGHLLGDVVVVEDLPRALELWRSNGHQKTLVTLDGETVDPHGVVSGGSRDDGSGVLSQKREIRELEQVTTELMAQLALAEQRLVTLQGEQRALARRVEDLAEEGRVAELGRLSDDKDLGRLGSELQSIRATLSRYDEELLGAATRAADLDREREDLTGRIEASRKGTAALLERAAAAADGLTRARAAFDQAHEAMTEMRVRLAATENQVAAERTRLEEARERAQEETGRAQRLTAAAADGRRRAAELREERAALMRRVGPLVEEAARLKGEVELRTIEHRARQEGLAQEEGALRQVRQALAALSEQVAAQRLRAQKLETDWEALLDRIRERWHVDLLRFAGDHHMRAIPGEAEEARLGELSLIIERMGEVNAHADEEFRELCERRDALQKQKDDVEKALRDLEEAIARINRDTRKLFRETFDAVNERFQEVLPRLFVGGRAELVLTDESNLLESGVDIVVQLPGKRLQTLELLSGGEKALTAVSLLFAIFLCRPTPFCLLDEVDAPLDDANVGRFADMVREMSQASQFILITHNKRTMEAADQLYGVTMEEPGVSKIVSVRLRDQRDAPRAASLGGAAVAPSPAAG